MTSVLDQNAVPGLPVEEADGPPRVLLVEDEALIALTLKLMLELEMGMEVIGPIARLDEAMAAARSERLDLALLDVAIVGGDVYPAANILQERGIPIIFHTGHGLHDELSGNYRQAEVYAKPTDERVLQGAMSRLLGG